MIGSGSLSFYTQMVVLVGPVRWILFFLIGAALIIQFRGSKMGLVFALFFSLVAIAANCAILFATVTIA